MRRLLTKSAVLFAISMLVINYVIAAPSSDQKRRLILQHQIDNEVPLIDATFVGTHNSFNNSDDGYFSPNHKASMTKQLEAGARVLSFDVYKGFGKIRLCHGACGSTDTPLESGLNKVADYLNAAGNENEVVMIIIQDGLKDNGRYSEAVSAIKNSRIKDLVYSPVVRDLNNNSCHDVPVQTLTKQMLLDSGDSEADPVVPAKRVILTNYEGCNAGSHEWRDWVWNLPNTAPRDGHSDSDMKRYPHQISIAPEDRLWWSIFRDEYSQADIREALRRGAGIIGLDFMIDKDRHEALIWSWKPNEPNLLTSEQCAAQTNDGRWNNLACSTSLYAACQHVVTGQWSFTDTAVTWDGAADACAAKGSEYIFAVPVNANLNHSLNNARSQNIGSASVWLNHAYYPMLGQWVSHDFISAQVPELPTTDTTFNFDGNQHFRIYQVPTGLSSGTISFEVHGGDGGYAEMEFICFLCTNKSKAKGGKGRTVVASFPIGTGAGEIAPGSVLAFVVGERGKNDYKFFVPPILSYSTGGGGGGSAVLIIEPGTDYWAPLLVSGGGGGAYNNWVKSKHENDGGLSIANTSGQSGGDNGASGGGGGFSGAGQGYCINGDGGGAQGYYMGGYGGSLNRLLCDIADVVDEGGYGYGGGGAAGHGPISGGGGGGGYTGGDGGANARSGKGGGSYLNSTFTGTLISDNGGKTSKPGNGYIKYSFSQLVTNNAPTVTADVSSITVYEGGTATVTGTYADEDGDTVTLSASVGSVSQNPDGTWSWSLTTIDGPTESQTVMIEADDGKAGGTASVEFDLGVLNVAPVVSLSGTTLVDEHDTATYTYTFSISDPSITDTMTIDSYSCGEGGVTLTNSLAYNDVDRSGSFQCQFPDGALTPEVSVNVSDDDGGQGSDALTVTLNNVIPTLALSIGEQNMQYSDRIEPVVASSSDVLGDPLSLSTQWQRDGGDFVTGLPEGLVFTADQSMPCRGTCSWTLSGQIQVPAGQYLVRVSVSDDDLGVNSQDLVFNVAPEDAVLSIAESNIQVLQVEEDGENSGAFALTVSVHEATPDASSATADFHLIENAAVQMTLHPLAQGDAIVSICTSVGVSGSGYEAVHTLDCHFDDVPVNTYTVEAEVIGGYYSAALEHADLTVFDPSLGFVTSGGWFYWPGTDDKTHYSISVKYHPKNNSLKGDFTLTRDLSSDEGFQIESDELQALALSSDDAEYGWSSFSGQGTYTESSVGELGDEFRFIVYVEDHGQPGKNDKVWIEIRDENGDVVSESSMSRPAMPNATVISGGNVVVHNK